MKLKDNPVIKKLAKELGLKRLSDPEKAIREYCLKKVEKLIKPFGSINDLPNLLDIVSSCLKVKFEEAYGDDDIAGISKKYVSKGELSFGNLSAELDDETDAVLYRLNNAQEWEHQYVAVIDCRGYKSRRAYFSKWHEICHILTLVPRQLAFQFKRTPTTKKDPKEQIVDRVAGDLAFYTPLFVPELISHLGSGRRLTFEIIEEAKERICPAASREATIRSAVSKAPFPQLLIIADYGYKKSEEQIITSLHGTLPIEDGLTLTPKLRAVEVIGSQAASAPDFRIHKNMEVPQESVITEVHETGISASAAENLNWWKHSRGRLSPMPVWVEAIKSGNRVFCLISPLKN